MAHYHHDEPTCSYADGYSPAPGDTVQLCTAQRTYTVTEEHTDGTFSMVPTRHDKWLASLRVVTPDHIDLVRQPQEVLF